MPKTSHRHKPPQTTNPKKNKKNKNKNNESQSQLSITKLIEKGDVSMEMLDYEKALLYYSNSCDSIRYIIEHEQKDIEISKLLLAKMLGKKGEARVSLVSPDDDDDNDNNAMSDFLEGINLLGGDDITNIENQDDDDNVTMDNNDNNNDNKKKDINRQGILSDLYLYLAQMRNGEDALMTYQKGITQLKLILNVISECIDNTNDNTNDNVIKEDQNEGSIEVSMIMNDNGHDNDNLNEKLLAATRSKICSAYCSMAELYLTDLCYSPNAEEQCETLLQQAFKNDTDNSIPDALQVMANLRLSQNKPMDASNCMLKVWSRMKVGCTSLSSIVGISIEDDDDVEENDKEDAAIELQNVDEVNALPNFEFRCQSAKLLFECASVLLSPEEHEKNTLEIISNDNNIPNKCLESSILILGSLLAENDEVIEIWYFLGCAFSSLKEDDMAQYYYEKTLEMLEKVKEELENNDDDGELQDICERIESVQDKLKGLDVSMEEE